MKKHRMDKGNTERRTNNIPRLKNSENEFPFDIRVPNKMTSQTFEDTNKGKDLKRYKSVKDMFDTLGM